MKAILLCAGYATRLKPLTENCPKHLLEVGDKTILCRVVEKIAELPIDGIYIVTNNKFHRHFEEWKKTRYTLDLPLEVMNDGTMSNDDRLGSIGDVNFVIERAKIDDDAIIVNADNLFTFALGGLHDAFKTKGNVIACYDVKDKAEAAKMGIATVDGEGRVTDFVEKPADPSSTEVSIGIYLYTRDAVAKVKDYVAEVKARGDRPDTTGDFVAWIAKQVPTFTYAFNAPGDEWVDIGTPEQLEHARNSGTFK